MPSIKNINTSQLSPADLQKIIDYIAILISIDRKNALNKQEDRK